MSPPADVKFKDYDEKTRREFAAKGWALSDGSFPIADKGDLEDALHRIGSTKKARATVIAHIRKRAKALGATDMLGEKTRPKTAAAGAPIQASAGDAAQFAERTTTPDGMVVRRGKVFEAGSRVDMHGVPFAVSRAELARMVMDFQPFPIGIGHAEAPSCFDGQLGSVQSLYLGENPDDLYAEAHIPPFVDAILGDDDAKVSMVFDRVSKQPRGLDFVGNPNVVDAALTASFAQYAEFAHDTAGGRRAMQAIHNVAAGRGAVCYGTASAHASPREHNAVQQIHDITCAHGAECDGPRKKSSGFFAAPQGAASMTEETTRDNWWQRWWTNLFAAADRYDKGTQSAGVPSENYPPAWHEERIGGMGPGTGPDLDDEYRSSWQEEESESGITPPFEQDGMHPHPIFTGTHEHEPFASHTHHNDGDHENVPRTSAVTEANPMEPTSLNARFAVEAQELEQLRRRNRQLEADLERERELRIEEEAVAFAEREISERRSMPFEEDDLKELYRQAYRDDTVLGLVKMADGTGARRTERMRTIYGRRSTHLLTDEQIKTALSPEFLASMAATTAQAGAPKPMDAEQKRRLMGMTDLGKTALAGGVYSRSSN